MGRHAADAPREPRGRRTGVVTAIAGGMAAAVLVAIVLVRLGDRDDTSSAGASRPAERPSSSSVRPTTSAGSPATPAAGTSRSASGAVIYPYGTDCQASVPQSTPRVCSLGDRTDPTRTIALVGDSKTGQFAPVMDVIGKARRWQIVLITHSSCAWTATTMVFRASAKPFTSCHEWGVRTLSLLLTRIKPDLVLTTDRPNTGVPGDQQPGPTSFRAIGAGMATYWARLADRGTRVLAVRETPQMSQDVPSCLKDNDDPDACSTPRSQAVLDTSPVLAAVTAAHGDATLLDLTDQICGASTCPAEKDGVVVYRDSHHLSADFVRTLRPTLEPALLNAL